MRSNVKAKTFVDPRVTQTHEGGYAVLPGAAEQLERKVATLMLFENTFYATGSTIAQEVADLCEQVDMLTIAHLAKRARTEWKLRHAPLFLLDQLVRLNSQRKLGFPVAEVIAETIQRPDEMAELLTLYWKRQPQKPRLSAGPSIKQQPLANQLKDGLARAFKKFNEYQLGKWNRTDRDVKLKDVLFLSHPKPDTPEQAALWDRLIRGTLATPDTWETALSAGADKKATFERLLREGKLGYMALLMNVRNMEQAGVDSNLVRTALLEGAGRSKALPFRFVSAAKHAPSFANTLSLALLRATHELPKLGGRSVVVIDVSGSMLGTLSGRSQLERWEAAGALAVLLQELSDDTRVFVFSDSAKEVANYRGLPLVEAIRSRVGGGTYLAASLRSIQSKVPQADRLIVVTDEQSADGIIPSWATRGYIVNVASYTPALDTKGGWTRISGWSERICDFIRYEEGQSVLGDLDDE